MTVIVLVALVLYRSTSASVVGGGDAPESLRGAHQWTVLHAPGYVLYSTLGAVVVRVVWFVPDAVALNGLSAAASAATAGLVFWICRHLDQSRGAAAIASLGWATTASVWFYAGFAKHDATTGLWVALVVALTVTGDEAPSWRRAGALGAAVGLSLGLGWPVVASAGLAVVWRLRPTSTRGWRSLAAAAAGAVVGVVMCGGLVVLMSARAPEASWGGATNVTEVVRLWAMEDFGFIDRAAGDGDGSNQVRSDGSAVSDLIGYVAVVGRDMGPLLAAMGLAGVGLLCRARDHAGPLLALVVVGNMTAVTIALSIEPWGFRSGIVQGGFLAPTLLALAVGAGAAFDWVAERAVQRIPGRVASTAVVVVVVGASIVTHRSPANQVKAPVVEAYGAQALADLDQGAVVLAGRASSAFPLLLAQSSGVRPDVTVVMVDALATDWYVRQLEQVAPDLDASAGVEGIVTGDRVVYIDFVAQETVGRHVPFQPIGLLSEVVPADRPGYVAPEDPVAVVEEVARLAATAGIDDDPVRSRWPTDELAGAYARPLLLVAQRAMDDGDVDLARAALEVAVLVVPDRAVVRRTLDGLPS